MFQRVLTQALTALWLTGGDMLSAQAHHSAADVMRRTSMRRTLHNLTSLFASLICASLALSAVPAFAQAPPAPQSAAPAVGKPLVSPGFTTPPIKVHYPHNVEATFDLTYASVIGYRPLLADIYRPSGAGKKPALVFVHGGSFIAGSPRYFTFPVFGELDGLLAYTASRGYVVVAISYRLSSEAKWPAQLEDVKAAVRWIRANADRYGVDPSRIGVWGESAGGGVASMAGATCDVPDLEGQGEHMNQSSCVQAAIDWYGVSDMSQLDATALPNSLVHNSPDSSQSRVLGCVLGYTCPASVVARANPIAYLDSKDTATSFLMQHGDKDTAVSWKQAQLLYDALRAKNIPATLQIVPGANHYFTGVDRAGAQQVLDTFFDFLERSLGSGAQRRRTEASE